MGTNDAAEMLAAAQAEVIRLEHQITQLQGILGLATSKWWDPADIITPPENRILAGSAQDRVLELLNIERGLLQGISYPDGLIIHRFDTRTVVGVTLIGTISSALADQIIAEASRTP